MSKVKITPLFGRVLLERPKREKIGSLILPADSQKRHATLRCKVLAKGPNADDSVKVGSQVVIGMHAGAWVNAEGEPVTRPDQAEFYIVNDEDILFEVSA